MACGESSYMVMPDADQEGFEGFSWRCLCGTESFNIFETPAAARNDVYRHQHHQ